MKILVLGGTRFFGVHTVKNLIEHGHDVTVATRGNSMDPFGETVKRLRVDRTNDEEMRTYFRGKQYDVVFDNVAYTSNDIKRALDHIKCERYVVMSSVSVYEDLHPNILEKEYRADLEPLIWCERDACNYQEGKRRAEAALRQAYPNQASVAIRFPYVIGRDDYTKRLAFYVEHIENEKPMFINNLNEPIGFISSDEAGRFLTWVIESDYCGTMNASSNGFITLKELIEYVENRVGKKAIVDCGGEVAPYNHASFSLDTSEAKSQGFQFSNVSDWIFELLDTYIEESR